MSENSRILELLADIREDIGAIRATGEATERKLTAHVLKFDDVIEEHSKSIADLTESRNFGRKALGVLTGVCTFLGWDKIFEIFHR